METRSDAASEVALLMFHGDSRPQASGSMRTRRAWLPQHLALPVPTTSMKLPAPCSRTTCGQLRTVASFASQFAEAVLLRNAPLSSGTRARPLHQTCPEGLRLAGRPRAGRMSLRRVVTMCCFIDKRSTLTGTS
jgi:hypothetical protein